MPSVACSRFLPLLGKICAENLKEFASSCFQYSLLFSLPCVPVRHWQSPNSLPETEDERRRRSVNSYVVRSAGDRSAIADQRYDTDAMGGTRSHSSDPNWTSGEIHRERN